MEDDKKKFNHIENVLNKINQKYISLPEDEKKRNSKILEQTTERITNLMKSKNILFRTMYERRFYGGSYYDGIKVGKPEEYDLDFVLNLPLIIEPDVEASNRPGFVQVKITEYEKLLKREEAPKYAKLDGLFDEEYLSTFKVLQWMEKILHLALNEFSKEPEGYLLEVMLSETETIQIYATVVKAYPAFTLKLKDKEGSINLDVDLVPCFQFTEHKWPKEIDGYIPNPFPERNKFLIVPKKPYGMSQCVTLERYWRLSFQEQERELMKGHKYKSMKPAIKLLKKLRDKQNHVKIASYYIKTIFLWEVFSRPKEFWKQPLSYVFMVMLKEYANKIQNKSIPYYWNERYNLIGHLKEATITDIGNTIKNIIDDIEKHISDPFAIAKYLINQDQIETLRGEVNIGKRNLKKLKSSQNLLSTPSPPSSISLNATLQEETEEERIKRLIFNEVFLQEVTVYLAKYLRPSSCDEQQSSSSSAKVGIVTNESPKTSELNKIILKSVDEKVNKMHSTITALNGRVSRLETTLKELCVENSMLRYELNKMNAAETLSHDVSTAMHQHGPNIG